MNLKTPDVLFPNLGIKINHLNRIAFSILGINVYWYGVIIGIGVLSGLLVAMYRAKKSGQNPETYMDFSIYALIFSIIGARLYYVVFSWDQYKDNIIKVFAVREGGLAIYGGVIAAVMTALVFTRKKRMSFWLLVDTAVPGLILGQAIGRWGNFINQEAFGGHTESLFAMCLKVKNVYNIPNYLLKTSKMINGVEYIQVHPTFLYESLWNVMVFVILMIYSKYKKFTGEIFLLYLLGYALGRVWIEGLRTDQLLIGNTNIPVSQLLAAVLIVVSFVSIIFFRNKNKKIEK